MENKDVLPEHIEDFITNGILDQKCTEEFGSSLRELLLRYPNIGLPSNICPDCNGKGVVDAEKDGQRFQEGCGTCGGEGYLAAEISLSATTADRNRLQWIAKARDVILSFPPEYNAEKIAEAIHEALGG